MTNKNQAILQMIRGSQGHLTAEQAFLLAKEKGISVSLASVYRILGKLAEEGYIKRIKVVGGKDIFDKTLDEHEHLVCLVCGKVQDISIANLRKTLIKQTGIDSIQSFNLCIDYVCEDCQNKLKNKKKEKRK
ncbi:MAG: transcriptional repressor [Erysipelotrichaceae bacterium]|nr:transcriptional repressor [Erysipelotrichaceae bacterium]